eukprot:1140303-Pelagomonas_calceolata.AAC.2
MAQSVPATHPVRGLLTLILLALEFQSQNSSHARSKPTMINFAADIFHILHALKRMCRCEADTCACTASFMEITEIAFKKLSDPNDPFIFPEGKHNGPVHFILMLQDGQGCEASANVAFEQFACTRTSRRGNASFPLGSK